jgi:hypothetical protein
LLCQLLYEKERYKGTGKERDMSSGLPRIVLRRRMGTERFRVGGKDLDFDLMSFWQCSASDLIGNTERGVLAEYLVARVLGLAQDGVRNEWGAVDLETPSGIKIQVKSAAYLQSWYQQKPSNIVFATRPTRSWDPDTNLLSLAPTREADVYVFALLFHAEKSTLDPMDLEQWQFYVVSRPALDGYRRSQHSITLKSLQRLAGQAVDYSCLAQEIVCRAAKNSA